MPTNLSRLQVWWDVFTYLQVYLLYSRERSLKIMLRDSRRIITHLPFISVPRFKTFILPLFPSYFIQYKKSSQNLTNYSQCLPLKIRGTKGLSSFSVHLEELYKHQQVFMILLKQTILHKRVFRV